MIGARKGGKAWSLMVIAGALCVTVVGLYWWAASSPEAAVAPPRPKAAEAFVGEGSSTVGGTTGEAVAGEISLSSNGTPTSNHPPSEPKPGASDKSGSHPRASTRASARVGRGPRQPVGAPTFTHLPAPKKTSVHEPAAHSAVRPAPAEANARANLSGSPVPDAPADKTMYLTIPAMSRVKDTPVITALYNNSYILNHEALHPEGTGFPWQSGSNVYIAGHRLGYLGTGSFLLFYDLDALGAGDRIQLSDSAGRTYHYVVYAAFTVSPGETWVMKPHKGEDLLTLQSCTLPDFSSRLIVRARREGGPPGGASP